MTDDQAAWRAVWHCAHEMTTRERDFPLGPHPGTNGSFQIHVCQACLAFCIKNHLGARLSDWHPAEFLAAAKRGDRSLLLGERPTCR